jgi:hypothetical protein
LTGHAAEVGAVLEEKRRWQLENQLHWPVTARQWDAVQRRSVEAMQVFPLVQSALLAAGIPSEPGFLGLDAATLKMTFRLASRMRARYTTLDFLEGQDKLGEAIDAVVP